MLDGVDAVDDGGVGCPAIDALADPEDERRGPFADVEPGAQFAQERPDLARDAIGERELVCVPARHGGGGGIRPGDLVFHDADAFQPYGAAREGEAVAHAQPANGSLLNRPEESGVQGHAHDALGGDGADVLGNAGISQAARPTDAPFAFPASLR